jgi:hypothetical protein
MGSIVQLGDVPAWIGAGTGAASLYLGLRGRRQQQAASWAAMVEELAGLTDLELRRAVEDNPVVAEIVGRAWEAAAETANEDKRRLLAKVATAAIRGDAIARVDDLQLLLRTVMALDSAHVTLLVVIGTPRPGRGQMAEHRTVGYVRQQELRDRWPSNLALLQPALATLEREGLITRSNLATESGEFPYSLNGYGAYFLHFLRETDDAKPTT